MYMRKTANDIEERQPHYTPTNTCIQ